MLINVVQSTCWHLWFFANFTVISKCCKCFSPFSVLAHIQCCCSEDVNYTCLWKHDKWPVTLMFLWAFLFKHPDHLISSKHTGCYAGCLRHGYQRSRMHLKHRAFPTPHICECVKRSEKVHNHPFSTRKSTSLGYQSNTNVYGPESPDWDCHIYIVYLNQEPGCSFYNETFVERWRTEGETYLSPSGRE